MFSFSNSFKNNYKVFITGGSYKTNPNSYIASGYEVVNEGGMYNVISTTMTNDLLSVSGNGNTNNNSTYMIFGIILGFLSILLIYLKRDKLIKLIKN